MDNWNFDTFGLNRASKGTPLRYVGYELLTRHGCLHKYKVSIGHPHLDGYWSLTWIPYFRHVVLYIINLLLRRYRLESWDLVRIKIFPINFYSVWIGLSATRSFLLTQHNKSCNFLLWHSSGITEPFLILNESNVATYKLKNT